MSGKVGAIPAAPGSGGAGRRPKHPELTRVTGVLGARVRRRSPASRPPAPRATVLLGWAARHRAPYLCCRPASLRRGRRWPRGHGGRLASRAEPVRVLTSPPGALRVHPGALECSLRTCQIPGPPPLGPASHVLPWPELIAGTCPGPGEPPGSGPHGFGVRGRPGGLRVPRCRRPCHLPRRRSAASAQLPGLMQLSRWSGASGSVAACATAARRFPGRPDPGPPSWPSRPPRRPAAWAPRSRARLLQPPAEPPPRLLSSPRIIQRAGDNSRVLLRHHLPGSVRAQAAPTKPSLPPRAGTAEVARGPELLLHLPCSGTVWPRLPHFHPHSCPGTSILT